MTPTRTSVISSVVEDKFGIKIEGEVVERKIPRLVRPLINHQPVRDDAGEAESGAPPSKKTRIDLTSETPTQHGDLQPSITTPRPVPTAQSAPNATTTIKSRIWSQMKTLKQQRAKEQKMEHEIDGRVHKLSQDIKALNAKRTAEKENLKSHQEKMEETEEKIKKLENLQSTIRETESLLG